MSAGANFEFNTFVKGLMTDANPLTFPENTSQDELNFVLNTDGSRQRRLGLNWDLNPAIPHQFQGYSRSYLWEHINSSGISLFVVQSGLKIFFHTIDGDGIRPPFIDLDYSGALTENYEDPKEYRLSFTSGFGRLFVSGKHIEPFFVEFADDMSYVTMEAINIQVRDLEGVNDTFAPDHEPTKAENNPEHTYNLQNQGWGLTYISGIELKLKEKKEVM